MTKKNNKKNEINKLCDRCERSCKQTAATILLSCPNFVKKPKQMEFKFSYSKE